MLETKLSKNSYQSILICGIAIFFFLSESIRVNSFSSLSLTLTKEFGIDAYEYAKISSAYLLGNIIFLLPSGILLDRIKSKYVAAFSTLACAGTAFCMSFATNYSQLIVYSFLAGVGASPAFILAIKLSKEWFTDQHIALMTGIIVSAAMIGGIIAQAPLLLLIQHISWRTAYIILSLIEIILFLAALIIIKDVNLPKSHHLTFITLIRITTNNLKRIIKSPINWIGGLFTCFLNLPITLLGAMWGQPYLISVNKLSPDSASFITMFIFLGVIIGSPMIGYLSDKSHKRRRFMLICSIILFFISLFLIFIKLENIFLLMFLFFIFGLISSTQSLGYTIAAENSSLGNIGITMSFIGILVMCGGAILQPFVGFILDSNRISNSVNNLIHYSSTDYQHAFVIFPISFTIATILILMLKANKS